MESRDNVDHVKTVRLTDFEQLLGQTFGDRFRDYRADYKRSLNYNTNGFLPDFPITVGLELVNRCNLSCIMCWTNNHKLPKFALDEETIRAVLSECQNNELPAIVFGLGSESLLYKNIRPMIVAAKEAGVMDIFLGTNGVLMDESMSEFLVDEQIARVEVSLDAATPETFKKIRSKDELDKIEANVRTLLEIKKRKKSVLPIVRLCFCVQDLNRDEREAFLEKWSDSVDYVDFQVMSDFSYVDQLLRGEVPDLPIVAQDSYPDAYCAYPFNSLHVWSNGEITPCCTYYGKNLVLGNVKETTLKEVWNGEGIRAIREQILSGNLNPTCAICLSSRDVEDGEERGQAGLVTGGVAAAAE